MTDQRERPQTSLGFRHDAPTPAWCRPLTPRSRDAANDLRDYSKYFNERAYQGSSPDLHAGCAAQPAPMEPWPARRMVQEPSPPVSAAAVLALLRAAAELTSLAKVSLKACETLACDEVAFFAATPDGLRGIDGTGWQVPFGCGLIGRAFETAEPVRVANARQEPAYLRQFDCRGAEPRSFVAVPLCNEKGAVVFLAMAANKRQGWFDATDQDVLVQVLDAYRGALLSRRLLGMEVLCDAWSKAETGSLDAITATICDCAVRILDCDRCTFFIADQLSSDLLGFFTLHGALHKLRVPNAGIVGVALSGQRLNITDAWDDPRFCRDTDMQTGYRTQTILCGPVMAANGEVVAILQCINKKNGVFDDEDCVAFTALTNLVTNRVRNLIVTAAAESLLARTDVEANVKDIFQNFIEEKKASWRSAVRNITRKNDFGSLITQLTVAPKMSDFMQLSSFAVLYSDTHHMEGFQHEDQQADPGWSADPLARTSSCSVNRNFAAIGTVDSNGISLGGPESVRAESKGTPVSRNSQLHYLPMSFNYFHYQSALNVQRKSLDIFAQACYELYMPNPYHNWAHAFSTFHLTSVLIAHANSFLMESRGQALSAADGAALLLAALGHDAAHGGRNNAFEVATQSRLALRYNDESVLESHHASLASHAALPLLEDLSPTDAKRVRKVMIFSIISTDMAKHTSAVSWLSSADLSSTEDMPANDLNLTAALLHCADLGHPVLPWAVHKQFSLSCCAEFFAQYQAEEQLGLPTLPFMGKDPAGSLAEIGPLQTGFLTFVCAPLWQACNRAFKGQLDFLVDNLASNHRHWEDVASGVEVADAQEHAESRIDYMDRAKQLAATQIQTKWRMKSGRRISAATVCGRRTALGSNYETDWRRETDTSARESLTPPRQRQ